MANYDKLSTVVSVILLCLALSLMVVLPTGTFSFVVRGSPLAIRLSLNWLPAVLLVSMACVGTASIVYLHPLQQGGKLAHTFVFWILPSLATLLAVIILPRAPNRIYTLGGLAMIGILLPLIITAEYRTLDPAVPGYRATRLGLNFIAYLIALILFALIQESKAPGLLMATAALVGSGLLALDLLHPAQQGFRRTSLYALIVGLVIGEVAWVMSYLRMHSLTVGVFLLLVFYLLAGLARQGLLESLSRQILIEFAVVALIGLALLLRYAP